MDVLRTDRQEGKTTKLMEWVLGGEPCDRYPYWTRVAVLPTMNDLLLVKKEWWGNIPDFDHRVYYLKEFVEGRFVSVETEYRFDNLDLILQGLFLHKRIGGFTITGKEWE